MVSALDSGSSGPGSSLAPGHCVVFLGKTLYTHFASHRAGACIYKWVTANLLLGATLQWTSITSKWLYVKETGISSGLMGHLAQTQTFPLSISIS